MRFEDKNTYQGGTHYPVCNERVSQWKETLDGITVKRAAGICGGGEVSFFAFAPIVSERLVLVDHSYISLWAAIGKYKVIEKLGAKKARDFITKPVKRNRPEEPNDLLFKQFKEANKGLATESCFEAISRVWWPFYDIAWEWADITDEDVANFRRNRANIEILHGDISDLAELANSEGQFELLYLSNALQYRGRNGVDFRLKEIVKPGGLVATAGSHFVAGYPPHRDLEGWEVVKEVRPNYNSNWTHRLYQRPT